MVKYKYVRVAVKSKRKKTYKPKTNQSQFYGLFDSADIGYGTFGFGETQIKGLNYKIKERKDFIKLRNLVNQERKMKSEERAEQIANIKSRVVDVRRGVNKVSSKTKGIMNFLKKKKKSIYD